MAATKGRPDANPLYHRLHHRGDKSKNVPKGHLKTAAPLFRMLTGVSRCVSSPCINVSDTFRAPQQNYNKSVRRSKQVVKVLKSYATSCPCGIPSCGRQLEACVKACVSLRAT